MLLCRSSEYKKARQEIKRRNSDTLKLQKKAKKGLHRLLHLTIPQETPDNPANLKFTSIVFSFSCCYSPPPPTVLRFPIMLCCCS